MEGSQHTNLNSDLAVTIQLWNHKINFQSVSNFLLAFNDRITLNVYFILLFQLLVFKRNCNSETYIFKPCSWDFDKTMVLF